MSTIRVLQGVGTGPTALAAYDAALAEAGVHDYNLVEVSSVVPADAALTVADSAPDLGPVGNRLTVVQSEATVAPSSAGDNAEVGAGAEAGADESSADRAVAGIGWARSADGPGIFYETAGDDEETVRESIRTGLDHGVSLRNWSVADSDVVIEGADARPNAHATAVVLAAYGRSEPIL